MLATRSYIEGAKLCTLRQENQRAKFRGPQRMTVQDLGGNARGARGGLNNKFVKVNFNDSSAVKYTARGDL